MKGVIWVFNFSKHALSTRALSRSRRAAAADSGSSAACRRAAAAAFRARPGAARRGTCQRWCHSMSRQKLLKIQTCKNAALRYGYDTVSILLCGEKYPTVSLVLLFRAEIAHALEITPTDCSLVRELKENIVVWIIGCLLQTCKWQQLRYVRSFTAQLECCAEIHRSL